ncbi:Uncharacterised protein [Streptococcus australis]|uniref:Uncharacterized protein n=1 Tax=Streptococcus australis ATCC 700641 TaxID=888833 RepID=E7S911_9STRE|nr:hypothetical protein [Streptococcus australis]EFW00010.1 hypothetical protein HMPREF9421_0547 [Streptococcus australis ATCC 700641]EGU63605.1 hypothetical protein HMPREF9961_0701 [Streptococcus australis ATCC 700641]SQH67251.1 Uncharacterised protein [Streptococcus australis]
MDTVIKKLKIPSLLLVAFLLGMGLEVLSHPPKSSTARNELKNLSTFKAKEFQGERLLKETNEKKDSPWTLDQIEHFPLSIKNQNGSLKQTGSRLETLLKEMGHPQEKVLFQSTASKQPSLSLLYRWDDRGKGASIRLLFSKGTDGSYLLEEIDASLANLNREGKKVFSEKVYQSLEPGEKMDLKALLGSYQGLQSLVRRQIGPDQEGFQLSYQDEKGETYLLEVEQVEDSYYLLRKSQLDTKKQM